MKLYEGKFRMDIRKSSSLRRYSVTGIGSPGMWSWHQVCQSSRSIQTMFLAIWFSFSSTVRTGLEVQLMVRLNDPYASLPTGEILWLCNSGLVKKAPERERYEKSNILKGKIIFFYDFHKAMCELSYCSAFDQNVLQHTCY